MRFKKGRIITQHISTHSNISEYTDTERSICRVENNDTKNHQKSQNMYKCNSILYYCIIYKWRIIIIYLYLL